MPGYEAFGGPTPKDYATGPEPPGIGYGSITYPPGFTPLPVRDAYTGVVLQPVGPGNRYDDAGFRAVPMSSTAQQVARTQFSEFVTFEATPPPVPAWVPWVKVAAVVAGVGLLAGLFLMSPAAVPAAGADD